MAAGRMVVVTGTKNGPGATTLAVGLAGTWAAQGRSVLLLDLDSAGGDVAAHLNVRMNKGLAPLLRLVGPTLRADEIAAECATLGERLRVLPGLPAPSAAARLLDPIALGRLLTVAADLAEVIVVDVGRLLPGSVADHAFRWLAAEQQAGSQAVLAVRADLPGVLNAQRALDAASESVVPELVAMAVRQRGDVAQLGSALGRPIAGAVPAAPRAIRSALDAARPPSGRGKLARAYAAIAGRLLRADPVQAVREPIRPTADAAPRGDRIAPRARP